MYGQRDLFTGELVEVVTPERKKQAPRNGKQQEAKFSPQQLILPMEEMAEELMARIGSLEKTITDLRDIICSQQFTKEFYSTVEIAKILDKKPYTVREWCRLQRVNATKTMCGRGCEEEWRVSHDELLRIQNEGLLPLPNRY